MSRLAPDLRVVPCRACGASMIWVRSPKGRAMPVNAEPDPKGELMIIEHTASYAGDAHEGDRYTSHFATCPEAASFRRGDRSEGGA